jgi:proteasome lid subunit RPN8/RPN11
MRRHAEHTYADECCGVLVGKIADGETQVQTIAPCRNIRATDAHTRFEIDPSELVRVQRESRENGMEIVGFYHSHPDQPARPSPSDLEHAHWIGCSYVIVSVIGGIAKETRSFFLGGTSEEDKSFAEQGLIAE